tara:strand:+ start:534 stop:908 length:375 start_codon:yes stop_codon:yes gene_type:complete
MPTITLTFANELNVSVQVGDTAYYVQTSQQAGGASFNSGNFDVAASSSIVEIGIVTSVGSKTIICDIDPSTPTTPVGAFIFFSKDNRVNTSGLLGYYAECKFRNNSTSEAELFSVASEIFESSK